MATMQNGRVNHSSPPYGTGYTSMLLIGEIPMFDEIPKFGDKNPSEPAIFQQTKVIKMDGGRAQAKYTVEASEEDVLFCPKRIGGSSQENMKSYGT